MATASTLNHRNENDAGIQWGAVLDTLLMDRKLIIVVTIAATLIGLGKALISPPVYETNLTIQIEDTPSPMSGLGDAGSILNSKSAISAEMEIVRSRLVLSQAVDNLGLHISAQPKRLPLIGGWLSHRSTQLSEPILGGYVSGTELLKVNTFTIPDTLQGLEFSIVADGQGGFELRQEQSNLQLKGKIGVTNTYQTSHGQIELAIPTLEAKAGAVFLLKRISKLQIVRQLQASLIIGEKGRGTGIISLGLEGGDPIAIARILNEIGAEYIRQNTQHKSEEAVKSLAFIDSALPEVRRALETSEDKYNDLRDTSGSIDIGAEGKSLLEQTASLEGKLQTLNQQREDLLTRDTPQHPSVLALDNQIRAAEKQQASLQSKVKKLPRVEQGMLRMMRDVKVNTELYVSLLNTSQQLKLLKASKVGSAHLIDNAEVPEFSNKPNKQLIVVASLVIGLILGIAIALLRKAMHKGIDDSSKIEAETGLPVYATIMESPQQLEFARQIAAKQPGKYILAESHPDDFSVESLRSFRVALQFAMMDAPNNRIMITGASPGIGKSFISTNLAAILAQAGKRVLLLDMDLHKGHLNQYFNLPRNGGLSDLLAGDKSLEDVTHKSVSANLDFITVGTRVANPSSLFLNNNLSALLEQLSEKYDVVMMDAPPVLLISDVSVVGPHIGTTFLVVRDSISTMRDIHAAQERLAQAKVAVKGVLFNGQKKRFSSQYGYGYKYGNYKQS